MSYNLFRWHLRQRRKPQKQNPEEAMLSVERIIKRLLMHTRRCNIFLSQCFNIFSVYMIFIWIFQWFKQVYRMALGYCLICISGETADSLCLQTATYVCVWLFTMHFRLLIWTQPMPFFFPIEAFVGFVLAKLNMPLLMQRPAGHWDQIGQKLAFEKAQHCA